MSYLEDKIYKHKYQLNGNSECCGAPVYDDILICSDCKDHCYYANAICKFCGDEHPEWEENDFCSNDCWNAYVSETFKD